MIDRLRQRWNRIVSPFWVAPLFLGLAALLGLLTQVVERGQFEPSFESAPWPTAASFALVAIYLAAWLLETSGVRWPRTLFAIVAIIPTFLLLLGGRDTIAPMLPMLVVAWVAYVGTRRQSALVVALTLASILLAFLVGRNVPDRGAYRNLLAWTFATLISWGSAYAIATQRRLLRELRAAQADLARQAAAEERRRIAREVHDVVAHSLAITMLHLTGARHILARDPQRAAEALAQAEQLGRQSLTDIRRTVGLLAADRAGGVAPPLPSASEIAQLAEEFTRAGLDVRWHLSGDPAGLSPATGLDLYRIAQEALTNAAKHAPGGLVEIDLVVGERTAVLRVRDHGPRDGAAAIGPASGLGLGIVGMRERAVRLGGSLIAQRDDRGWLVECCIPVEQVA